MKQMIYVFVFLITLFQVACENDEVKVDYSGTYCLNLQNIEMIIAHRGNELTFTLQNDLLVDGSGIISGDTLFLNAITFNSERFTCQVIISDDLQSFSGPFSITNNDDQISSSGILVGTKGECNTYDIGSNEVPKFIESEFTQINKIEKVSKFRSGFGHSFTDGTESCRSMKHYFTPFIDFRENHTVEIFSPVTGMITSVSNDGHGASTGLLNKEIQIKPDDQPAFIFQLFHCDLVSAEIAAGKKVQAGELLGYARLYYEDLEEYATSFDLALWVNTTSGMRLISYFDALTDDTFEQYIARGAESREDFIISKEERDADPIQCDGERFLTSGNLESWFILNSTFR